MSAMVIDTWTGRTASLLQSSLRMTHERFAEHLGISTRTVTRWHQLPDAVPGVEAQGILDTAYEQALAPARARFAANFPPTGPATVTPAPGGGLAVEVAVLQARMEQLQQQLDQLGQAQREMTLLRVRMEQLQKRSLRATP